MRRLSVLNRQIENTSSVCHIVGLYKYAALVLVLFTIYAHNAYAADFEVKILKGSSDKERAMKFYPEIIPASPNDSISWYNEDGTAHSITSGLPEHPDYAGVFFKTGTIPPGKSGTIKIDSSNHFAYYYFCEIHPWLEGKVVVETAPESQPETQDAIVTEDMYFKDQDILVSGRVAADYAKIPYEMLVYEYPDKLIDVKHGKFDQKSSYIQTIEADDLQAGKYLLKVTYGLPTQVAIKTFEITPQKTKSIPGWVKDGAKWWSEGTISDGEFIDAIEFLAKEKIITIQKLGATDQSQVIPTWVKTNAGWWADGMISDKEFTRGLQYLVNSGVIQI